jgi:hypothetical protein
MSVLLYSYFRSIAEDPCLARVETFGPKLRNREGFVHSVIRYVEFHKFPSACSVHHVRFPQVPHLISSLKNLISDKHSRNEIHTSRPGRLNKSRDYVEIRRKWLKRILHGMKRLQRHHYRYDLEMQNAKILRARSAML